MGVAHGHHVPSLNLPVKQRSDVRYCINIKEIIIFIDKKGKHKNKNCTDCVLFFGFTEHGVMDVLELSRRVCMFALPIVGVACWEGSDGIII